MLPPPPIDTLTVNTIEYQHNTWNVTRQGRQLH
jgi:hypothetical protein